MALQTMKAVIYAGPDDIRVEDYPMPDPPAAGELLVHVRACGICGTDVTNWYMAPRAPVVLGHEPAGEVVAVGAGVTEFAVGDRVALHHHVPCMVCDVCQHGHYSACPTFKRTRLYPAGMAEYVRVPREIVAADILKLPDGMPYEVGALIEPIACCVRGLDRANIRQGDTVLVVGAGFGGVVMALLAPHWGADRVAVLDLLPSRLQRARSLGLSHTFQAGDADLAEQIRGWTGGVGPHAVIATAASPKALDLSFDLAGPGATVMIYALSAPEEIWPLRFSRVIFQEITITGTYSAGPYETRRALSLLKQGWIDTSQLITHRFPLEQADQAWLLTKQKGDSLKVMVAM